MTTIADEFHEIRGRMLASYIDPKRVSFNHEGYRQMMLEAQDNSIIEWDAVKKTYMGLPYEIRPEQWGLIALHDSAPGRRPSMSASQLCDVIRGWLDADDATHWGTFEKELDGLITRHCRMETKND